MRNEGQSKGKEKKLAAQRKNFRLYYPCPNPTHLYCERDRVRETAALILLFVAKLQFLQRSADLAASGSLFKNCIMSGDCEDRPRKRSRWDQRPDDLALAGSASRPLRKSRWDVVPTAAEQSQDKKSSRWGSSSVADDKTPSLTASVGLSDRELNELLPAEGYEVVAVPIGYTPIRQPHLKLKGPPPTEVGGFQIDTEAATAESLSISKVNAVEGMDWLSARDMQYFGKLADGKPDEQLDLAERKERKLMRLLLKIKSGTAHMRKHALRQLTDQARDFGPELLFNQILPLLMAPNLEGMERHLLVKVVDRVLHKIEDQVRPFVHKILVVIEPLLIDEDYYARLEGRDIIASLAKAAGLPTMLAAMRPDIDHADEYVRNTTSRALAVVACALGIYSIVPFITAVCKSKKSWQARHTATRVVNQIALLAGCGVLPCLRLLVNCISPGLEDEQFKVRTATALAIAALAEASAPYGIESFDVVLKPIWTGVTQYRGKPLGAFLKAIGFLVTLMDADYANYYTKQVMSVLMREFQSPDDDMKRIVLQVTQKIVANDGVEVSVVKDTLLPEFVRSFWVPRTALDKRSSRLLVETSVALTKKVGFSNVAIHLVKFLKETSEPFRKMAVQAFAEITKEVGSADLPTDILPETIDGLLFAFQEQAADELTLAEQLGRIFGSLGTRLAPYIETITSTILWRLNNKSVSVRQQAADLISQIAPVMSDCSQDELMGSLGVILYEYLGEEYPDVLGSILGALKSIVAVIGIEQMRPPVQELIPRLTPILKNRHEKVQENCIDLVGRVADRGAELIPPREWMRICFDLLELLKAHKKAIRRATISTFGFIARAIGPHDVVNTLLNHLKVQDRQMRVCTTVALAVVAESCAPFTVLPALMYEYRTPELNVQNGVLKSLSFMFEYIGSLGKDYVYAIITLLEDALMDRDQVHRQTACTTVKHIALGVVGQEREDALVHLLNFVWPNILETSPHVLIAVMEAIEALTVALGPGVVFSYVIQGLFHPARRVRKIYWRIYNAVYGSCQDSVLPYYPSLKLEDVCTPLLASDCVGSVSNLFHELEYVN